MIIRDILQKDFESILALNEISVKVLSPMDREKLVRLIKVSAIAVVLEDQKQVAGVLLAFSSDIAYESINYQWFNDSYNSFLYIDRIVVSENYRGKGVASRLFTYALEWAKNHSLASIFAEIDVMPANDASLLFHQKQGFKQLQLLKHNEHKMVLLQQLKVG
ncbi:MAG: GNAT family N-acetyltransferase [Psychromonas sp.]